MITFLQALRFRHLTNSALGTIHLALEVLRGQARGGENSKEPLLFVRTEHNFVIVEGCVHVFVLRGPLEDAQKVQPSAHGLSTLCRVYM